MAQNQNDIQLRINAAVDGLQDIGKLLSELDEVGADTTSASADVEKLNEAMSSLAQQRKLIDSLEQTRGKVAEAEQAMNEAVGEADRLRRAYDESAQGVEAQRRAAQLAAEQAEAASDAYQQQRRELQALQTQYKGVQESTTGARQAWRDAAQRVRDLEAAIEASGGATAEQARQLDEARGAADQARRSYDEQAGTLSNLRDELTQQRTAVNGAKESWEDYRDESRDLNRDLKESERAFARQGKELDRAQQVADKASTSFQRQGKALDELSTDAREAGVNVDNLADEQQRLDAESQQLEGSVDRLKGRLREYRQQVDQTDGTLKKLGKSLAGGVVHFAKWAAAGAAAGAALSVGLLTRYTAAQAKVAQQVDTTSEAIDVNAQRLQALEYAFRRVGLGGDKTGDLLKDVADKIGDAYTNGGGEAKDAIDALGLSLDDLIGMSPDQQLLAIGNALDSLPPASQVNVLESLGNDATLLLPLLRDNAAGLRELTREAEQVGAIMSPEDIEDLKATNEAIERLQGRLQGLRNRLLGEVSPAVNELAGSFDDLLEDNPGLIDDLAQVFRGLIQTTQRWMQYVITNSDQVGASLQGLIDTGQFLANTFVAVFRGVQTAAAGALTVVAGVIAGIMSRIELVARGLNRLGLVSDETMRGLEARAASARQAVKDLAAQTVDYGRQTLEAGKDAVTAFDNTADAAEESAERQERAGEELNRSALDVATAIGEQANAHEAAAEAAEASARRQKRAMEQAAETLGTTVDELKTGISENNREAIAAFETLARSGEVSAETLREAFGTVWDDLNSKEEREAFRAIIQQMSDDGVEGAGAILSAFRTMSAGIQNEAGDAAASVGDLGAAAQDAAGDTADANKKVESSARGVAQWMADGFQAALEAMDAMSVRAGNAFRALRGAETTQAGIEGLRDRLVEVNEEITRLNREALTSMNATGITAWAISVKRDAREVERAFLTQKIAATELFDELQKGERTGVDLSMTMDDLKRRFDLLDDATLSGLEGEIRRIRGEVESLRDSLADTLAAAEQERASLEGDRGRVEELQFLERQRELQEQLNRARQLGDNEAQRLANEALQAAERNHELRMRQIREESDAEKQAALQREREAASRRQREEVNQRESEAFQRDQTGQQVAATRAAVAQPTRRIEVLVRAETGNALVYAEDEPSAENLITALGRDARRVQ